MIMIDGREMVDVVEAARLSHRSPETIRRWIWTGRVTSVKQGNKHFVPRAAVEAAAGQTPPEWNDWLQRRSAATRAGSPGQSAAELVIDDRRARTRAGR